MYRKFLYALPALFLLVSCGNREIVNSEVADNAIVPGLEKQRADIVADSTYYGFCTDGTAMHTLQFVAASNDTITLPMGMGDDPLDVYGGITIGSDLAVTPASSQDGNLYAKTVVNMSGLIGAWTDGKMSVEILKDGSVKSSDTSYKRWKVVDGNLFLSDTPFGISYISEDSLYLVRNGELLKFNRTLK